MSAIERMLEEYWAATRRAGAGAQQAPMAAERIHRDRGLQVGADDIEQRHRGGSPSRRAGGPEPNASRQPGAQVVSAAARRLAEFAFDVITAIFRQVLIVKEISADVDIGERRGTST